MHTSTARGSPYLIFACTRLARRSGRSLAEYPSLLECHNSIHWDSPHWIGHQVSGCSIIRKHRRRIYVWTIIPKGWAQKIPFQSPVVDVHDFRMGFKVPILKCVLPIHVKGNAKFANEAKYLAYYQQHFRNVDSPTGMYSIPSPFINASWSRKQFRIAFIPIRKANNGIQYFPRTKPRESKLN